MIGERAYSSGGGADGAALGSGTRLCEAPAPLTEFELTGSVTTTKGVIIARYTRR